MSAGGEAREAWEGWISSIWPSLVSGASVHVPAHLSSPGDAGFTYPAMAEDAGQVADWTLPRDDGSRVHVHVYASGRRIVHLDAIDPERGALEAAGHWLTESRSGRGTLVFAGSSAILWLVSVLKKRARERT